MWACVHPFIRVDWLCNGVFFFFCRSVERSFGKLMVIPSGKVGEETRSGDYFLVLAAWYMLVPSLLLVLENRVEDYCIPGSVFNYL